MVAGNQTQTKMNNASQYAWLSLCWLLSERARALLLKWKDIQHSSSSTSNSKIYFVSLSQFQSCSTIPESYKKSELQLSLPSPYAVSSRGKEVVKSSIISLCPSSVDTLTNSITQTIEIDITVETHRKLWTWQSRPQQQHCLLTKAQLRTTGLNWSRRSGYTRIRKVKYRLVDTNDHISH